MTCQATILHWADVSPFAASINIYCVFWAEKLKTFYCFVSHDYMFLAERRNIRLGHCSNSRFAFAAATLALVPPVRAWFIQIKGNKTGTFAFEIYGRSESQVDNLSRSARNEPKLVNPAQDSQKFTPSRKLSNITSSWSKRASTNIWNVIETFSVVTWLYDFFASPTPTARGGGGRKGFV